MMYEPYTPEVISEDAGSIYVKVLLELDKCGTCGKPMIEKGFIKKTSFYPVLPFPGYFENTAYSQMKRAGWIVRSDLKDKNDHYICEECAQAGKATFVCALCGQERSAEDEQESFGSVPPEYLCRQCYESVSAKEWDKTVDELEESHKWDSAP